MEHLYRYRERRGGFHMIHACAALAAATILLSVSIASAQPQPYGLKTFGEFRTMMMQRDFASKVTLAAVIGEGATDGVGALSGARGEITIFDGKPIISYGVFSNHPAAIWETAMLLQTAVVREWQEIRIARNVAPGEVEAYLAEQAMVRGLDPEKSFAFRVRGTLASYAMHVLAGPADGFPPFVRKETKGATLSGVVAGLYVSSDLVGVATHMGERTHSHWISDDGGATAHLDVWGIKSGAVLLLPKP
jgi:hypothetical protein